MGRWCGGGCTLTCDEAVGVGDEVEVEMAKEHQQLAESSPKASRTSRAGFTSLAKSWRKTCVSHFILNACLDGNNERNGKKERQHGLSLFYFSLCH